MTKRTDNFATLLKKSLGDHEHHWADTTDTSVAAFSVQQRSPARRLRPAVIIPVSSKFMVTIRIVTIMLALAGCVFLVLGLIARFN